QLNQQKNSLCILLEDGHSGIHGRSASRIKEMLGKAVIIFSQTQHDSTLISGSARSIDNIHIKTIIDNIAVKEPQLIIKF
ncbi:DHHA1 domain-containing protein, partial [Francisella tularensis subsp. holarctica]|uniref:DHHA1 domain-containing protein n=1 Tax=Francisella tularensis TaxID=263 RepID=UPI002381BC84